MLTVDSAAEEDIAHLQSLLEALRGAVEAKDWQLASDSHVGFHSALLRALHLPALDKLLEPMQQLIVSSSMPPQSSDDLWDVEAHVPIIEALIAKDRDAMAAALARHYQRSRASGFRGMAAMPFRRATSIGREQLKQRLLQQRLRLSSRPPYSARSMGAWRVRMAPVQMRQPCFVIAFCALTCVTIQLRVRR